MEVQHHIGEQLDSLLNDSDGVQLFHEFLSTRFSSGHLLDFWFACKGFRAIIDGDDQLKLLQVAKAIYRTYIRTDAASSVPVNESTKREIRSTLTLFSHANHKSISGDKKLPILRSLFDAAQMDIQNTLARSYFLDFVHSDAFRLVRQSLFNPETLANIQSAGLSGTKACTKQSRQQSEKQLVVDPSNQPANRIGDFGEPFSAFGRPASQSSASRNFEGPKNIPKPHCADALQSCRSSSVENAVAPPRPAAEVAGVTESSNGAEVVTASDLIAFMNATSEMQKPAHIGGVSQVTSQTGASESRKPHTNLAEVDPNAFVQTLSHRLEKVRESRGKMEKLLSRMQPTDAAAESTELDPEFSAEKQQQQQPSQQFEGKDLAVNLPLRSFSRETGGRRRASSSSRFLMTSRVPSAAVNSACLRKKLSALVCDDVDDAQVILEDHCSRIWTDEAGEEDLLQLNQSSTEPATAICPPAPLAQRKTHHHQRFNPSSHHADVYSISSFDSGVVTCGGLNSSDSESCISRCQNQGTHNRGIYPAGGATAGKYASSSAHHKHCFKLPPSTAAPPPAAEDCFGASGPGWNPALPPPPACFFCQRPSMNSTPSVHRKAPAYQACWAAGAYPAPPPIYPNQYPEGLQSSRTMRSRSLTSDSPSVFDSGLSSTYDQLPVARRPRQDEQDQRSTEAFNSLGTPMPTHVTRMGPPKEVPDPARLHDQSFRSAIEKPVGNDCGPPVSCPINPAGPHLSQFPPGDDNNLPHRPEHKTKATVCGGGQKTLETSSVKPVSSGIGPVGLVVGYYLCDDPVPYRTVWTGSIPPQTSTDGGGDQQSSTDAAASATDSTCVGTSSSDSGHPASITLGQFKQLVAKKGVYRYFFKTASDEFGTGVVHEEIGDDNAYLPLWEGKVIARVERAD
ncbi:hypothetical protein AAHC03_016369 [Spirometra sp. Aus1]